MKRKYSRMTLQLMIGIACMNKTIDDILEEYPHIEMVYILAFISSAARNYFEAYRR
ncbi:MAG TPA: hypothetical protein VHV10_02465 [Ktedonobacteraceae bacterium]|jgi:uncharacterized protein (DUF433 family)|nr:hypothetical protein [Ktedonobacteraceae bacterium]